MSVQYQAVLWNRQKRIYDCVVGGGLLLYLVAFCGVGALVHPNATVETLLIRGLGTAALLLLHIILCTGPLCRLDKRFYLCCITGDTWASQCLCWRSPTADSRWCSFTRLVT